MNPKSLFMSSDSTHASYEVRPMIRLALFSAVLLAVGLFFSPERIWSNLLISTYFLVTVALGGAVFVALTYVSGAGWHVAFRRVPEAMASTLPIVGTALLVVLSLRMHDYGWEYGPEGDAGTFWFKQYWLTPWFWLFRAIVYVVIWSVLADRIIAASRRQDSFGNPEYTSHNVRLSAAFLAIYAVTFSLACADWLMALEPMWFSTIWGVYHFAGMTQATLAAIVIVGLVLRRPGGQLRDTFNDEHLHDLGKLLLGFSCFWMYIWFSQYMLIWYTNIPEETSYFIARTRGPWGPIVVIMIVLNWIVPFFGLLPRRAKRSGRVMMRIAVVVLIGRWVDLYVMVFPSTIGGQPIFGVWEVAAIAGTLAIGGLLLVRTFASAAPIPGKDPFLRESLEYHAG